MAVLAYRFVLGAGCRVLSLIRSTQHTALST